MGPSREKPAFHALLDSAVDSPYGFQQFLLSFPISVMSERHHTPVDDTHSNVRLHQVLSNTLLFLLFFVTFFWVVLHIVIHVFNLQKKFFQYRSIPFPSLCYHCLKYYISICYITTHTHTIFIFITYTIFILAS